MKNLFLPLLLLATFSAFAQTIPNLELKISVSKDLANQDYEKGRMIVFLSKKQNPEPLFQSTFSTDRVGFAINIENFEKGKYFTFLTKDAFFTGSQNQTDWEKEDWFVQAVYNISGTPEYNAAGNLYCKPVKIQITKNGKFELELTETVKPHRSSVPEDTQQVKYVELESKLLSDFWRKPMKIRASVLLPGNFEKETDKKYPVRINIGGYGSSWTRASRFEKDNSFITWWNSEDAPEILNIFTDGEGPYGDPYYVDSENNGPYGRALTEELIPFIEKKYRGMEDPKFRFLDGCSTGGWVSLALQIFYPDYFNGAWSFSADPVDFHHMQLINMYDGKNAYYNKFGYLMPSFRTRTGQPRMSIKDEVAGENLQSFDNSYTTSGGQWGAWNAVYSPKGMDGKPAPAFDPVTGNIHENIVERWKKYDLLLILKSNWKELGPKLQGKIWVWMGDMDDFYLNNAMREMDIFLKSTTNPASDAIINFEPTKGHCQEYDQRKVLEMIQEKISRLSAE